MTISPNDFDYSGSRGRRRNRSRSRSDGVVTWNRKEWVPWSHDLMTACAQRQSVTAKRSAGSVPAKDAWLGNFEFWAEKHGSWFDVWLYGLYDYLPTKEAWGFGPWNMLGLWLSYCDTTRLGNLRLQDYLGGLGGQKARWGGPDYWSNPLASVNRVFRIFDDPFRLYPILPEVLLWAFVSLFDFWLQVSLQELQDFFKDCGHIVEAACKIASTFVWHSFIPSL